MTQADHPTAVMDATSALCRWGARMIHRLDRSGEIRIAPIRSETGGALMRDNELVPFDPDTWLFIEDGKVWRDFDAVIRVGQRSGRVGSVFSVLRVVPRPLRDWLYQRAARNCYAMLGRAICVRCRTPRFARD